MRISTRMTLFLTVILFQCFALATELRGNIATQADTVHVEFFGNKDWNYDLKKNNDHYELTIDSIHSSFISQLSSFKSSFVKDIEVTKNAIDGRTLVKFKTLPEIEVFDYLTDQPSRLILDFYADPKLAQKKTSSPSKVSEAKKTQAVVEKEVTKEVAKRDPAATDAISIENGPIITPVTRAGVFDGADPNFERFGIKDYELKEDAVIKSRDNYYIPFPSLRAESETWTEVKHAPSIFQISAKKDRENKMARLLLGLFEKRRYNVYLKTLGWFTEKYPKSEYFSVIDYLTTAVHQQMWEETGSGKSYDLAQLEISNILKKYPTNPLSLKLSLQRGYMALEKGDNLSAIQLFQLHINDDNFGKNPLARDLAKMGMAQAYMKLNQYPSALESLDDVSKNGSTELLRIEAQFRRGDVFMQKADAHAKTPDMQKKFFAELINEYQNAQKKNKNSIQKYPNSVFNTAEAQFWLKNPKAALETYTNFIRQFPTHSHSPFALTRIGEILEILGADQSKVIGAYLETYFRYGESPSAVVARMRLLGAKIKSMKSKELEAGIQEIKDLSKRIELPSMEQFSTILIADGLRNRGAYERAGETLIKYYQENPTTVDKEMFEKRIVANINDQIASYLSGGDFINALKTHAKYSQTWLKGNNRLDTNFYVGKAFETAGVEKEADKYYRDVLNKVYALKGTAAEKELKLLENLPSTDVLNLRLAATSVAQKKFKEAYDYLKDIKNPESLSEQEQVERVDLAVKILDRKGEDESAVRYLTELLKLWKGQPALVAGPYLKLAELELKMNKEASAVESLEKISQFMTDTKTVDKSIHFKSLQMLSDIYAKNSNKEKLISTYEKMLSMYEGERPLGSIRYKLGEIYFSQGDLQKASTIWNEFKGDGNNFWSNLAQEKLKNSKWNEDYKKYIQRIPAMEAEGKQ